MHILTDLENGHVNQIFFFLEVIIFTIQNPGLKKKIRKIFENPKFHGQIFQDPKFRIFEKFSNFFFQSRVL